MGGQGPSPVQQAYLHKRRERRERRRRSRRKRTDGWQQPPTETADGNTE